MLPVPVLQSTDPNSADGLAKCMRGDSAVNGRARERAWRGQRITAASDESHDRRYHNDHIADSSIAVQVLAIRDEQRVFVQIIFIE